MSLRPKALLFDWDNTLVDSWGTIHDAWVHTLTAMGHRPWTLEETRANVRKSLRDTFPEIFGGRWEEARALYLARFRAIHLELLTPMTGAAALLEAARGEGLWLGIVSNKTGPILRLEAERLGWTTLFSTLVGAGDSKADKPDPAVVEMALEGSGLRPGGEVWIVGDTGIDMECAFNAGCVPVLVSPEPSDTEEFRRFPPAHSFAELDSLALYLSRGL